MRRLSIVARRWLALVPLVLLLGAFPLAVIAQPLAQEPFGKPTDPSPALGHAQVIAHGVAAMPAGEVAWRVAAERATAPRRAFAALHDAGFALADSGVVAVTDGDGNLLTRIAPGEAAWLSPAAPVAVVSLEEQTVEFYDIALVPAADSAGIGQEAASAPFTVPDGAAFDVMLLRDVVTRNEESDIATGALPGLLLVTKGSVSIASASGDVAEVAAGEASEIRGEAIVTGTSRAPAAFVVAQLGPELPQSVALQESRPPTVAPARTPTPTPIPPPTVPPVVPAVVSISSFICPVEYGGGDYAAACLSPSTGIEFYITANDAVVQSAAADTNGNVLFSAIAPGDYLLAGGIPGDFASSRVRCLNVFGDDIAQRFATNQIAVTLEPGDDIACNWYIVPVDARGDAPAPTPAPSPAALTISSFTCPAGYTGGDYGADCLTPSTGVEFALTANGATIQSALAGANGDVAFQTIAPGEYVLVAGVPGDFASSRVRCLNALGEDIARRFATNQIAVTVPAGDQVACNWYIVPENASGA